MARRQRLGGPHRRHGAALGVDRVELERSGWRTTLEYRENHVRGWDGRLRQLQVVWHAEAERAVPGREPFVVSASASSVDRVWTRLRAKADLVDVRAAPGSQRRAPDPGPIFAGRPRVRAGAGA